MRHTGKEGQAYKLQRPRLRHARKRAGARPPFPYVMNSKFLQ